MAEKLVIGGIEGGATHSNIVLLDAQGRILVKLHGPGSNHHLTGISECQNIIADMVNKAKRSANIPQDVPLQALGLSLSGCEQASINNEIVEGIRKRFPNLSIEYIIDSDTAGSIATTSNEGGVVCISGTGSNTLLVNADGTSVQCGGWGYQLGDEGSGWYIANRAVKICIDALDKFKVPPHPIDKVWDLVLQHFKIKDKMELLEHFYTKFDKAFISSLCSKICELAHEDDPLAKMIAEEAGRDLAKFVAAVVPMASESLRKADGGIHVLCVGSVWKSFDLLRTGFVSYLKEETNIEELSLMVLTTSMAVGAAYLAADRLHINIPRTYSQNYRVFYRYSKCACDKNR